MVSDLTLLHAEGVVLALTVVSFALAVVVKQLRRRRPHLDILTAVSVGVIVRLLAVAAVNASGRASTLRGGDETAFLDFARQLAATPWGRGFLPHGPFQLQTVSFAAQLKVFDASQTAMRVTQIGIAMLGLILIVAAVYDLAGPRPAQILAWIFAVEPSNVFFNSELHKEPLMVLASGLVVFGGTRLWRRLDAAAVLPCVLGAVIAIETRSYAGWFLVVAAVLILLHSALRRLDSPLVALPIVYGVLAVMIVLTPTLLAVTSKRSLATLQASQSFTTGAQTTSTTNSPNGDNLALEQVNFSTRGAVISHLPSRMFDVTFRPFPWQLADISQQLGALASVFAMTGLILLVRFAWRARTAAISVVGPLVYPLFFLLAAYSLSAGNAGTGFRYRSHIVILGAAILVVLRDRALNPKAVDLAGGARENVEAPPHDGGAGAGGIRERLVPNGSS